MPRKRKGRDISGWLNLNKPAGLTSNQALGRVKRLLQPKKAGHAGTLDPLATGVLPIALGEATKTVAFAMEGAKAYRFAVKWGESTDTLDSEGEVVARSDVRPTDAAIDAALPAFVGEIEQVPPQYSAIKVEGERAYDLARAGETVELEARTVRIDELRRLDPPQGQFQARGNPPQSAPLTAPPGGSEEFSSPLAEVPAKQAKGDCLAVERPTRRPHLADGTEPTLTWFEMTCGKGAYVRALVRDLAHALGAEGHVAALTRTRVGAFTLKDAMTLAELEDLVHKDAALERLLPVETALDDIPALAVTGEDAGRLRQGRAIVLLPHLAQELRERAKPRTVGGEDASRLALATCAGDAVALGEVRAGRFQPVRVFQH